MYFVSDSLKESAFESSNELIFLHGILQNLKEGSSRETKERKINQLYSLIRHEKYLKSEFDDTLFNDAYIIDSSYNFGIDFISNVIKLNNEERLKIKDLFNRDKSEKAIEVIHDTYFKRYTSNLFIFTIVLITACLNKIFYKERFEIYLRLNLFLKPEFRDYLEDRYHIYRDPFSTTSTDPNEYVCDVLKYIFGHNYNNSVENNLFYLTSKMFYYCDNYHSINDQSKSRYIGTSEGDICITKDELKYVVAYWLLGNEDTI